MKILTQKCDYCLQEVIDTLGQGYQETKRVFKLGIKEACLNCHEKAQSFLELSKGKSDMKPSMEKPEITLEDITHSCKNCETIPGGICLVCKHQKPMLGMWVCEECWNKKANENKVAPPEITLTSNK